MKSLSKIKQEIMYESLCYVLPLICKPFAALTFRDKSKKTRTGRKKIRSSYHVSFIEVRINQIATFHAPDGSSRRNRTGVIQSLFFCPYNNALA